MCGRFTLRSPARKIAEEFGLSETPALEPRYNIAPTQNVAAVRRTSDSTQRELVMLRWGLVPSWADDPAMGSRMINARAETIATKPAFRWAFRKKRCLDLADGFFEWKAQGGRKQPYYVCRSDARPFAFAGLWDHWQDSQGASIDSCTLITTEANELTRSLHDRMPVILAQESYDVWLDPALEKVDALRELLRPAPALELTVFPVQPHVNNPRNDDPACIEPLVA